MDDLTVTPQNASTQQVDAIRLRPDKPKKTAADWVREMRMSPGVNKTTTGVETDRVTADLLLATSSKLLGISKREQHADPKDSLEFQRFYGPAEYFAEHVLRDGGKLGRNLLWKATNRGNLDFMQSGALDQHVSDVFYDSKLAQMIDGSSPLETVDASYKTTRVGEGGVADVSSAPDEMRTVQSSYFGFLDPVRSPERMRVGLDMYMTKHCMKGSDGKLYQKFIDAKTGKEVLVDSVTASKSVVACPEMMEAKTKSIFALGGPTGVRIVPRDKVDYFLPRSDDAYSLSSNMVTMPSAVKEMRLLMGCLHPMTNVLVVNKRNELSIIPAKMVSAKNMSIPGCDKAGKSIMYPMQNSVAKFPQKKKWFKKVVLRSGRTLITSYDHKWPILRDGKQVLVQAQKLNVGDTILRTTFKDLPNRRTFMRGVLVNKDMATLLGCIVRSMTQPDDDKVRIVYFEHQKEAIIKALERLNITDYYFYANVGDACLGIRDKEFIQWLQDEVGTTNDTRRIPSVILSACVDVASAFIDAYTADKTLVGIDSNEDLWILEIPNLVTRDGLAILFSRLCTDTLYRDAVRTDGTSLALKLVEAVPTYGDMIKDTVKCVLDVDKVPIMIDIDINDNLYATANGVVTHNSKYPLQAVSLDTRETPLVRGLDEATGKDMATLAGKYLGARFAKSGGVVSAVRKDRIDVIYDDGTKGSVPLYQNFPMNAKGFIHNKPVVKAGQSFKEGQILASSNYTDDNGVAAIGTNLRSGWMSWKGGTYEDAAVLSESAAKKLTSTTMYKTAIDLDKTVSLGKKNYQTWKPAEFTKDQLEMLDDYGVIKPGSILRKGDPMILAVQTTEPSPGTMGKRVLTDVSELWEHDHPGVVTDIVRTRKGVKVFATVTAPAEVGDKISGLHGNKCYSEDTEILTDSGFKFFKDLTDSDKVMQVDVDGSASFVVPSDRQIFDYNGVMLNFKSTRLDIMVTPDHRMAGISKHDYEENGKRELQVRRAHEVFKKPFYVRTAVSPTIDFGTADVLTFKTVRFGKEYTKMVRTSDFAKLLGLYLAEGSRVGARPNFVITQKRDPNNAESQKRCDRIEQLFNAMGLNWCVSGIHYTIMDRVLADILGALGKANMKYIPEEWLRSFTRQDLESLLEWHYLGDGDKTGTTHRVATTSKRLADTLQRVHILLGHQSSLSDADSVMDKKEAGLIKTHRNYRMYRISDSDMQFSKVHKGSEFCQYNGKVYCVTVPTGMILVRRNGKVAVCGNCEVAQIIPDDQMPCDKNGNPLEVLWSPLGLISRTNQSQVYEALLGKVAKKTGKPEVIPAFFKGDLYEYVANKLKENHISADEDLIDPETGRVIPKVMTGYTYTHKLKHLAESKMSARGTSEYTSEGLPGGSGFDGSKRFGGLEQTAMVGHDAFNVILDAKLLRGQNNADFWRSIRTGEIPTIPGEPLVHKKFFAHLTGSGINIRKTQKGISCFTLSNDDVKELAGPRELRTRDTYEAKNFRPIDGGLFGQDIFGINGDKWAYIQLDEPMPNPVMEDPLAKLLRMSEKEFIAVASGKAEVRGMKNSSDIKEQLSKINLDAEAAQALKEFKNAPMSKKDGALKRYVAIERMRRQGVAPEQYMLDRIPVLPPIYRPVSTHNGLTMVADSNYLYAQLMDARDDMRDAATLPDEYKQQARENLYRSWKELTGLYEPENAKLKNKHVQGLLKWALGDSPKWSAFQRKIVGATVDTVGRGVVVPNPRLKLNQVGVPQNMAFGIMAPFVERALVKRGYTPVEAMKQVKKQTQQAKDILLEVMKTHPVLMNRAPSLHKLNIMAFDPVLVPGHAIHVNPSIVVPFCMDFDGDQANLHVPVSDAAREEARRRMFPERNLIAMKNRQILYKPEKEYQQGLYIATRMKQGTDVRPRTFRSLEEAREARRQGLIDVDDPIIIQK